jgi:outer membrane receptor protein involved in Fe transport
MKKLGIISLLLLCTSYGFAQQRYTISASIQDKNSGDFLPFATITLRNPANNKLIGGAVSDERGKAIIQSSVSNVEIQVDYVGFETLIFTKVLSRRTDLGSLQLTPKENQLTGIDLVGRRSDVEIRLDKRVYNVGQNLNAKGTNVSDVLENIPSLSLDLEGNLELRGSTNVRILIDGKPSGLVGLNGITALADLPAESIERVEVITAPSARYQAEGSSGIVNIILAKNTLKGLNGVFNVSGGKFDSYGANASLNYKVGKFNFFTNSGYGDNTNLGGAYQENTYMPVGTYDKFYERRSFDRRRVGSNVNLGVDINLAQKTKFTFSYVINDRDGDDITSNQQNHTLLGEDKTRSLRSEVEKDKDVSKQLSFSLTHKFDEVGHKLDVTIQTERIIEDEFSDLQTQTFLPSNSLSLLEENNTEEHKKQFLAQLDYVWPIDKNTQFEAGYRSTNEKQDTGFTVLNEIAGGTMVVDEGLTNFLDYEQTIHAVYSQFGKKWNGFSFLAGLRYEHTDWTVIQKTTSEEGNNIFDGLFPTLNIGVEFSETANLTFGYNRRLSRPGARGLNPFRSRASETSFFQGNPNLRPSYSDGFDLGFLKQFKKFSLNSSIYFTRTYEPRQRITVESGEFVEVNGENTAVIKRFPVNFGSQDRLGFEANSAIRWSTKWRTNISFNIFKSIDKGTYENLVLDNENESWSGNFRNNLKLPWEINTQVNVWYVGPQESAYGNRKGFGGVSLGLSKDILNDNATINLNFNDVFNNSIYRWNTFTESISTVAEYQRRKPYYKLTFTYRFRQEKDRQRRGGGNYGGGEGVDL